MVKLDNDFDVIVVGSGLAGLSSAITACESGLKTLVLEKMESVGGSSSLSVGAFAACGTPAQKRAGIIDSEQLFYNDIIKCGEYKNVPELVKTMVTHSYSAFKFLKDRGVGYGERLFVVDGHSVPRSFQVPAGLGVGVINPLHKYYLSLEGSSLYLKTNVVGLIYDRSGRVVGVKAIDKYGLNVDYFARKAVIMATGGFARGAAEFLGLDFSKFGNIPSDTSLGADADTLKMLIKEGAATTQTEFLRFGTTIAYNDIEKGVLVDIKSSSRFISESAPRNILTEKIIDISSNSDWPVLILDKKAVSNSSNDEKLEKLAERGDLQEFESIYDLALFFCIDYDLLQKSISRYNELVELNIDKDFGKDFAAAKALSICDAPFYACIVYPKLNYTQGGVTIDKNSQVLCSDGSIIEGLYACGEVTGGVHGKVRLTCCSTLNCTVFGIIAGKNASKRHEGGK